MFTSMGAPCLFYGDELGMTGKTETELRAAMDWGKQGIGIEKFIKELTGLRAGNKSLIYGNHRKIEANDKGLYIYQRQYEDKGLIIALNSAPEAVKPKKMPDWEAVVAEGVKGDTIEAYGYGVWIRRG